MELMNFGEQLKNGHLLHGKLATLMEGLVKNMKKDKFFNSVIAATVHILCIYTVIQQYVHIIQNPCVGLHFW